MVESDSKMKADVHLQRNRCSSVAIAAVIVLILSIITASITTTSNISLFRPSTDSCTCPQKFSGMVEDCCCDYETVDCLNQQVLHPSLQELVKTSFFRYFKVKLSCDCPFWPDDGICESSIEP
ncbi:Endoplasmic reticulum oxidoreductin-1 [Euphorbia peplus]|nr:Endoplasmic reticulum oxidoreductin-1 [Euphorbia peplus]